ncbi:putative 4 histone acetyltransferase complex subunit [Erysiphe necator]|uniref:Chromatin modification-related protein EAF6 n=1 Tax=Uncinula necator TaxID=52586 RepID=A0A0B1P781_UNCNE|nr:putative 4 histone acetyltransferase complex subunit [Erysiphe necator]
MPDKPPSILNALTNVNPINDVNGQAYYVKMRKQLGELIQKRREIELALASQEELIAKKEQEYLEETPIGNIIAGFDNYTKGGIVSGRRRGREEEDRDRRLRVFSRSSISWNPNHERPDVDQNILTVGTNGTVLGTNSQKNENASGYSTPIITMNNTKVTITKKHKKATDDSEGEGREPKKARVNFGIVRK